MTNLQLLIAKAIIEKEQLQNVDLLFIGDDCNKKNLFYLNKLRTHFRKISIRAPASKTSTFKTLNRTRYAKKIIETYSDNYRIVFFANFHAPLIHHILSHLKFRDIKTFDDGTNNINKKSVMYDNKPIKITSKLLRRIMGRKYHKEDILKLIKKHYSLFPNKSNIIDNTEYIALYKTNNNFLPNGETKKVLLGTVYSDAIKKGVDKQAFLRKIQEFIDFNKIDIYIPHPRESVHTFKNILTIDSVLIAEDILINYLEKGYFLKLYGFNTTVQFNLSNITAVENYNIKSSLLKDSFNNYLGFDFKLVELK
ncbi:glycosyltransferase family 52 [Escherichia fergusonii]|uniref:glycosyltransferase family 52 n=1 Tax=Escherichia fergusonii TaxID=564 RepID=UPI0020FFF62D|nr:glycosyltransferase family 52 [Escherichia fergusonii]